MKLRTFACPALLAIALVVSGCARTPRIEAFPAMAAPGEMVHVRLSSYHGKPERLRVMVADRPAHIVRATLDGIDVVVPFVAADSVDVLVRDGEKTVARTGLRVLPPRSIRLLLSIDGRAVRVVRAAPSNERPTGQARTKRTRLSFDVVNRNNVVVYSGSIPHPGREPRERFFADASGVRAAPVEPSARTIFPIYIPTPGDSVRIDVYEAGPNLDLMESGDRDRRRRMGSIEVGR